MKILILGGAGFIGYHLACKLSSAKGKYIEIVDNFQRGKRNTHPFLFVKPPQKYQHIRRCRITSPARFASTSTHIYFRRNGPISSSSSVTTGGYNWNITASIGLG